MHSKYSTHSLVVMALFASLLCVFAYITIPIPTGQHITLQNFILLLTAFLFPLSQSLLIVMVWLLLGIVGIPVFVGGNAGLSYLLSPVGGYTFAFLLIAGFLPLVRPKNYNRITYTILAVLAVLLIDMTGAAWVILSNNISIKNAILLWILPYLPLDLVKAVIVAWIVPKFRQIIAS